MVGTRKEYIVFVQFFIIYNNTHLGKVFDHEGCAPMVDNLLKHIFSINFVDNLIIAIL